eukprot:scaffold55412_cov19-Tisochrysis_lutea.AAC.1
MDTSRGQSKQAGDWLLGLILGTVQQRAQQCTMRLLAAVFGTGRTGTSWAITLELPGQPAEVVHTHMVSSKQADKLPLKDA